MPDDNRYPQRFFSLRTGVLAFRYARKHRHDNLGSIAVRCLRCAPMEYEGSPQRGAVGRGPAQFPEYPPPSDTAITLAELQASYMDARDAAPPPPALKPGE